MRLQHNPSQFEDTLLRHFDAAYNLARWLTKHEQDAEDVVQESYVRAYTYYETHRGGDARSWLLKIVRNTAFTWLRKNRPSELLSLVEEDIHSLASHSLGPEAIVQKAADTELLRSAIEGLPAEFREVVILRDLEDLSYKDIAAIADIPIGTVMSRLARARRRLAQCLGALGEKA